MGRGRFPNCVVDFDGSRANLRALNKSSLFIGLPGLDKRGVEIVADFTKSLGDVTSLVHYVCCIVVAEVADVSAWAEEQGSPPNLRFLSDSQGVLCDAIGTLVRSGAGMATEPFLAIVDRDLKILWMSEEHHHVTAAAALEHLGNYPHLRRSFGEVHHQLRDLARVARLRAHAPYSMRREGCVIRSSDGRDFLGATLENCAYPNTITAIKAAVVNAIASGATDFDVVAFWGSSQEDLAYPAGSDRELLLALGDVEVLCCCGRDEVYELTSSLKLLPQARLSTAFFLQERKWGDFDYTTYAKDSSVELPPDEVELCIKAIEMCRHAFVPVSRFPVGAAISTDAGVFGGANIEAQPLDLGTCAERTALCTAVANGATSVEKLAVVGPLVNGKCTPCGGCRQNVVEWGDIPILMVWLDHVQKTWRVEKFTSLEVLPLAFTPTELGK